MNVKENLKPDASAPKKLQEKDFIQETKNSSALPPWLFIAIVLGILCAIWAIGNWVATEMAVKVEESPFLHVTNRQMSLFLWQNPEYMRAHANTKTGYLPGFNSGGNVNPKLESIDEYVSAPPELLFRYHTWYRFLETYVMPRNISPLEFKEFLESSPEWLPEHWAKAPDEYKQFVQNFDQVKESNLQELGESVLPKQVRNAFFGWKNYYREGDLINRQKPTVGEMREFISHYPNYARNYWRNLYPEYLKITASESIDPKRIIPEAEFPSFLRVAYFNWAQQASRKSS